jgi:hypothetical protein
VEVSSPELPPGAQAEVIVLVEEPKSPAALTQLEALEKLQNSLNLTPEAARQWIEDARAERQSWGNRR